MLIRVSCDRPAALFSDGEFLGAASAFPAYARLGAIAELRPLSAAGELALPLAFPAASLLGARSDADAVAFGKLVDVFFRLPLLPPRETVVRYQENIATALGNVLVTAFSDGGDKVTLGGGAFGIFDLPAGLSDFRASGETIGPVPCVALRARRGGREYLFVYDLERAKLLYRGGVTDCAFGARLTVVRRLSTIARHRVAEEWSARDGELVLASYRAERDPDFSFFGLRDFAKPYALAEEILAGGDPSDFLVPDLRPRAEEIREYFGNFTAVVPPPSLAAMRGAAIVRPAADGSIPRAEELTVALRGGLIENFELRR